MRPKLFSFMVLLLLLVACAPERSPATSQSELVQPTSAASTSPSKTPVVAATSTPEETGLRTQCVDVAIKPFNEVKSSGIVIFENRAALDEGHYKGGTFLFDMETGKTVQIDAQGENQIDHAVSPNNRLMAYESVIFNPEGKVTKEELVIADATGKRLKVLPWEEEWYQIPIWSDNEHVVFNLSRSPEEDSDKKPLPLLLLNPFTDERRILKPDFSGFPDMYSADLPYWEGRWSVIYDPALTYAIYPHIIENDEEMYTYAIWDLSKKKLVASLENIFARFSDSNYYPMPKWSPDGSRFVFQGSVPTSGPMKFELYEVSREGQTKQLTDLSSTAYLVESTYSWSPDGRYVALFLYPIRGTTFEEARLAVLDTETLNVTDYCMANTSVNEVYAPIWSPDGKQLLVTGWYEKDRRVILVDVKRNIAAQVAEDMEPFGWMVAP